MPPTLDHQVDALLARVTCRMLDRENAFFALENPQTFDPQRLRIILDGMVGPADETLQKIEAVVESPAAS